MKTFLALCLLGSCAAENVQVTPVQKVIQLMEGMVQKGTEEKQAEEIQFATFKSFCESTVSAKAAAIEKGAERMEKLKADIEVATSTGDKLGKEVAAHEKDIAVMTGDKAAATKVRKMDKSAYDATHKDLSESIHAITEGLKVLKANAGAVPQASFMQLVNKGHIEHSALAAFIESSNPPEAAAYESHGDGFIKMLNGLSDKFTKQRKDLEAKENESKQAYDMLMQELSMELAQENKDRDAKADFKASALQDKANAEADLADTATTREDDIKYKTDLTATCETKATDFETRQKLRAEEIEAVNKAIEIISGGAVSGASEKHLPQFLQIHQQQANSFVQVRTENDNKRQQRVQAFLNSKAQALNSRVLSMLAGKVMADPFAKVKKMVKDLIVKLMEEANEEATQKGYCDKELGVNTQVRTEKTQAVEMLHAEIDQLETSVAKLTEDVTDLTNQVAELDAAMTKATDLRMAEKAKNTQTISDSKEAQTAVAQALAVLKEFYAKAAESTALVQQQQEPPETFDKPYTGMGGASGGVVGMLEVIESDFARLQTDTEATETAAQEEFEEFMFDSKKDKAGKDTTLEHKTAKKQDQSQALAEKQADLEGTQKELDAAIAYYEKLKPSCVNAGGSYEEKVAQRKEEIESLQEALRILNGEDMA